MEEKSGIPLLVLHGGPGMTHFYLESLETLSNTRPVIFYDQLGCGNSIAEVKDTKSLWTIERFVDEVQSLIKGGSHCHHLEKPDEFNKVISEFMEKNEK
nr:alpha/beta hydrolase [Thermovirga lienii]